MKNIFIFRSKLCLCLAVATHYIKLEKNFAVAQNGLCTKRSQN